MSRSLLIYDPAARPHTWSDRMQPGEFAVLCEDARTGAPKQPDNSIAVTDSSQICSVFDTQAEAEQFARSQVERYPAMRCVVFDHEGRGRPELLTVCRPEFAPRGEIGPGMRRWVGGGCLLVGLALAAWEMAHDYETIWAGTLAMRLLPVAAVFLGIEFVLWIQAKRTQAKRTDRHLR
jgi:hypothetical protein